MKIIAGICTAAAMLLTALPVSAEFTRPVFSGTAFMTPNYPLEHSGDATLYLSVQEDMEFTIEILQDSPERKGLLLYGIKMPLEKGEAAAFGLEAGDYTVRLTVPSTKDQFVPTVIERSFNVLNIDFAETYKQYDIYFDLKLNHDDTAENTPTASADTFMLDDSLVSDYDVTFVQYDRMRGDFNGNGKLDTTDARKVLEIHTMRMTHLTPDTPPTPGQMAACDIDGNGLLDSKDCKKILDHAVASSIGIELEW
ncbi:MAG: hypothetical protein IK130_11190 [Oscillospiraceae bacterium]|nr:hypothetical protein [Oscillospiraceae bacterium]